MVKKAYFQQQRIYRNYMLYCWMCWRRTACSVTSINSAQVSWSQYEKDLLQAAQQSGCRLQVLQRLEQPASFPNWLDEQVDERYLKGFVLRVIRSQPCILPLPEKRPLIKP